LPAAGLSDREVRLLRLRAQGLLPGHGFSTLEEAAGRCLGIQAQDVPTARFALRARTDGQTVSTVTARAESEPVCRSWLMRNTVHLFADEDLAWMRPLLAPTPMKQAERRLRQLGAWEQLPNALERLRRQLERGPLSRDETRKLLAASGIEQGEGQERNAPFYWTFHAAALGGALVMRPALDTRSPFGAAPPDRAGGEDDWGRLAHRYLKAYGPATVHDFAYWGKVKVSDARRAWERVENAVEVETSHGAMAALPGLLDPPDLPDPSIRLLGTWDNYMLGHKGRKLAVRDGHGERLPLMSGFRCAIADGVVFAAWKLEREQGDVTVAVHPFGRLPKGAREGLEREAADIGRFLETDVRLRVDRS
jgi:hypothetical protein